MLLMWILPPFDESPWYTVSCGEGRNHLDQMNLCASCSDSLSHSIPGDNAAGFGECVLPTLTSVLQGQMVQWYKVIVSLIVQNDDTSLIALTTSHLFFSRD